MKLLFPKTAFILGLLFFVFSLDLASQAINLSKSDTVVCDTFPPPRNLDGLTWDNILKLWWLPPVLFDTLSSDTINLDNLLFYKIMKNGIVLDTVYYAGEDTTYYYDTIDKPGPFDFNYYVSALYDLTPCGFPGLLGESNPTGTFTLGGISCTPMPYSEDWSWGTIDPSFWEADENWSVNMDYGNPSPTAEYANSSNDTSYQHKLLSWWFDCIRRVGGEIIDGDFYLEFDLELSASQSSDTEYLSIELTDSIEWIIIDEFSNSDVYIPWIHRKLNLTEWAKGEYIQFAFVAHGENPEYINSWFIDNIRFYRQCHPPRELHWSIIDEEIRWTSPLPHTPTKNYTGKGLQGYNIYHNDSIVGFTTDTTFTFLISYGFGPYFVTAVYEDCEPSSNYIYGSIGTEENPIIPEINIYPNPCNEQVIIESNEGWLEIQLINPRGEIVLEKTSLDKNMTLNTSSFSDGIYFLKIKLADTYYFEKVIIHH